MPRPQQTLIEFAGGLDYRRQPYSEPHVRELTNAWFSPDDHGALEAMPGFARITAAAPAAVTEVHSLAVGKDAGDDTSKVYVGADVSGPSCTLYEVDLVTGIWTSRKTGLTAGAPLDSAQIGNILVFVNGNDPPFQIDLATDTVTTVGLTRPSVTNASTSLSPGGGFDAQGDAKGENQVRGVVRYWLAEISAGVEGAISASFGEIDAGDGSRVQIDLTHADFSGKTYRVYRTQADGDHPFMVLQSAAGGSTHIDNVSDFELGNLPYLHGDPPPEELVSICTQFGRLWGFTADGILYFCDAADHQSWFTSSNGNWLPVGENDGDAGTAVRPAADGVYCWNERHLYHVYAQDVEAIQVTPLTLATQDQRSVGTESPRSVRTTPYGIAFYSKGGQVNLLRGLEVAPIGQAIQEAVVEDVPVLGTAAVGYSSSHDHLWLSFKSAHLGEGICYLFDFSPGRREWIARYYYSFLGFAEVEEPGEEETLFGVGGFGSTNQAKHLHRLYSSENDANGDDIPASAELSPFFGRNPAADKMILALDMLFEPKASGSFDVSSVFDGITGSPVSVTVPMAVAGAQRARTPVNLHLRGREISVTISSSASSPRWKVYGYLPVWHEYERSSGVA